MLSKSRNLKLFHDRLPRQLTNNNASYCFSFHSNPLYTQIDSPKSLDSPNLPILFKLRKIFESQGLPICLTTESVPSKSLDPPNLPTSFKLRKIFSKKSVHSRPTQKQKSAPSRSRDEDFVIPSLSDWVDSYLLNDRTQVTKLTLKENDVASIRRILKERYTSPEKVAEALDGCGVLASKSLVEKILKSKVNNWVSALGFFTWAKSQTGFVHSPESYNLMIDMLGRLRKFNLMWDLVEEMDRLEEYNVTLATITNVMKRLARARKYEEAVEAFRNLERFGVKKDTESLNVLMDALVKGYGVEQAHKVFLEFKDVIPLNFYSFNVLIYGWCKVRKIGQAYEAMEDMKKHGFHPDTVSYNSLIEAYCNEKDFGKVDEVFETMKENGCYPNVATYTIIMNALGKAGQVNKTLKVYEKMKSNDCIPNYHIYSLLIHILGRHDRFKDAREVFEDMPEQGVSHDVKTYNTMIFIACEHSKEEAALRLLKEMEDKSIEPDLQTYLPLLKMCCRKKRMKVLKFLLHHMFRNNVSLEVSAYAVLVRGLCKSGKLERACFFFEEMISQDDLVSCKKTFRMLVTKLESKSMLKEKEHIESLMALLSKKQKSEE